MRAGSQRTTVRAAIAVVLGLCLNAAAFAQAAGFYYRVQQSDSLDTIARRFRVPAYDIAKANRLNVNDRLRPGSHVWVPGSPAPKPLDQSTRTVRTVQPKPTSTPQPARLGQIVVQRGDSLWRLAQRHGTSVEALIRANGIEDPTKLEIGQVLRLPGAGEPDPPRQVGQAAPPAPRREASAPRPAPATTSNLGVSTRGYSWPLEGEILKRYANSPTSKHAGLDIAVAPGTPVHAARSGEVIYAGSSISAYGKMVIIRHSDDMATCYAYNSELLVKTGDRVSRGEVVARSGDTGKGGEPYLHFQIRRRGEAVDPEPYLP